MEIPKNVSRELKEKIYDQKFTPFIRGVGRVASVGDGVIGVLGIPEAFLGEIIEAPGGFKGIVLNLRKNVADVVVLDGFENLIEGSEIYTTGKFLNVPSGNSIAGRVVSPLGKPLDGKGPIATDIQIPIERKAYGITERQPVIRPLQTGIKIIDSMIPIGRGQRELIIGDRATGKTAIALDTIINQGQVEEGKRPVICFYVAIGQKESKVAKIVAKLQEVNALKHTVVIVAGASDPVSWQYLAPYAGTAMAEYFLDHGRDALIVYDDLSRHAWAYRELSLVLRRPPGREAYPGDIFYLHSKLLERSCQLSENLGGGSLTALPIIETQSGDVSAYIPTNVISITDGQIYLDRDLFNSGFRPAVNIGLSVSRVGGKAQTKIMKQITAKLRLELAQYRELSAFSQFAADLDIETRKKLEHGDKAMETLKQDQYQTLRIEEQEVVFFATVNDFLDDIDLSDVRQFIADLVIYIRTIKAEILKDLSRESSLGEPLAKKLREALSQFKETRNYGHTERN